ncbi:MAG: hypothetical protein WAQ25_02045 [Candidatus Saccharimonas sp.]
MSRHKGSNQFDTDTAVGNAMVSLVYEKGHIGTIDDIAAKMTEIEGIHRSSGAVVTAARRNALPGESYQRGLNRLAEMFGVSIVRLAYIDGIEVASTNLPVIDRAQEFAKNK